MLERIAGYIQGAGIDEEAAKLVSYALLALFIIFLCLLVNFIARRIVLRLVERLVKSNKFSWDDSFLKHKVFHRIIQLGTPLIINFFAGAVPAVENLVRKGVLVYIVLLTLLIVDSIFKSVDEIYRTFEISKTRPIKSLLQVIKIVLLIVGTIIIIAILIGESPLIILSGIGALSAVLMLIFQSSILGFVAGIQLTANDMVRIGDWIEMSKYDANGIVVDLTLTTVKVENFDKTITTIPANAMVNDSFKNWRGMQSSGGRRIMRSLYIDISSVKFCDEEMLKHYEKIEFLKDYIKLKQKEIVEYNRVRNIDTSVATNGRRLTNIGTFRFYILNYLKNHPGIHKEMTLMVRQLAPGEKGLPIEIYAFTNTTDWVEYENIQSDIFDHLLAVVSQFELRVFQNPTGLDIKTGLLAIRSGEGKNEL